MSEERCRNGHVRTPEETYIDPGGKRYCRECLRAAKRRQRATEEGRERDRAVSRAWKDRNREANRARDRAHWQQIKVPCPGCGKRKPPKSSLCQDCHRAAHEARISRMAEMWADGATLREIAAALDTSVGAVGVDINRARKVEPERFPYRYARVGVREAP